MISDVTQNFIRTMAARGVVVFPVAMQPKARQLKWTPVYKRDSERERATNKRRARGCRIYAQPFKDRLPERSDPSYRTIYMRLVRAAKKGKQL